MVHRPERVIAVGGAKAGEAVGPALVAAVLADAAGGRKGVPAGARFWALINKVSAARLTAALLVERGVERVVLAEARSETAVVEVVTA